VKSVARTTRQFAIDVDEILNAGDLGAENNALLGIPYSRAS
jgi:hypothetical protein